VPPEMLQHRLMRHMELAIGLFSLGQNMLVWTVGFRSLLPHEHLHQATLVSLEVFYMTLLTCLPHAAWLKYRWEDTHARLLRWCVHIRTRTAGGRLCGWAGSMLGS